MSDWFDGGGTGAPVDVDAIMDSEAPVIIWRIVAAGSLVSVGTTSDGGALSVTVTLDGRYRREYFRDSDSLVEWLTGAEMAVAAVAASPVTKAVSRRRRKAT